MADSIQIAFDKLLARLNEDRVRAAEDYEKIRKALVEFFERRGSRTPEEDTDETISRVAYRLSEGEIITSPNPVAYFYAVARNVWLERLREHKAENAFNEDLSLVIEHELSPLDQMQRDEERRIFEECLQELSASNRELILEYYQDEAGAKIESRRKLATQLGISINALRRRVHQISHKLRKRFNARLGATPQRAEDKPSEYRQDWYYNTESLRSLAYKLTDEDISSLTPRLDSALQILAANQTQIDQAREDSAALREETKKIISRILVNTNA